MICLLCCCAATIDLRRSLGPARARLSTAADGYRLAVEPGELDTRVIEDQIAIAKQMLATGDHSDLVNAHRLLISAQEELRQGLAPGCEAPTVMIERQRLTNSRIGLIETCGPSCTPWP